ncbi:MAG TPA: M20/M25/M40 family metallo-hydrolase [Steroidobacteraceae bacterium]|nr:M20/M25/M40 family metallo-hydrolase [Steroidobacteraceae bacterium]
MLLAAAAMQAHAADPVADIARAQEARFREVYRELVETDTSLSTGNCTLAAQKMAARLAAAGHPASRVRVVVPPRFPKQGNLLATIPGADEQLPALLLLAHIDVVEAKASDWKRDPYRLVEEDGWFYARGAIDDKAMAASFVDAFVRYAEEGFRPRRTLKLALTCGEETDATFNGVQYLLETEPGKLAAGFAINEGGSGALDAAGKPVSFGVQVGEKIYQDFTLVATAPGGHSARPTDDNAIGRLAAALVRVDAHRFPIHMTDATRTFFARSAAVHEGQLAIDLERVGNGTADAAAFERVAGALPLWNAYLRTTCIPTQVVGGHAPNAQPQRAEATVNCRIMPGERIDEVRARLVEVVGDSALEIRLAAEPGPQPPAPPLDPRLMRHVEGLVSEMWPGIPVILAISTGATDGRFLNAAGIPTYGVSGLFRDPDGNGVHGLDERVRVRSLLDARAFLYRLVRGLATD